MGSAMNIILVVRVHWELEVSVMYYVLDLSGAALCGLHTYTDPLPIIEGVTHTMLASVHNYYAVYCDYIMKIITMVYSTV